MLRLMHIRAPSISIYIIDLTLTKLFNSLDACVRSLSLGMFYKAQSIPFGSPLFVASTSTFSVKALEPAITFL